MKLIYISHPFSGDEEKNRAKIKAIKSYCMKTTDPIQELYINPIAAIGAAQSFSYRNIIEQCLILLSRCDRLLLCGDWQTSRGCWAEYAFAVSRGIPIEEGPTEKIKKIILSQ